MYTGGENSHLKRESLSGIEKREELPKKRSQRYTRHISMLGRGYRQPGTTCDMSRKVRAQI